MKPTDNEVETAIVAAEAMRESGADEHHVAKTLLYQYQRLQDLEKIREAAENYLHFGQEEPQHAQLVLVIEAARKTERQVTRAEEEDLGLG
jgi:hypothetical protein